MLVNGCVLTQVYYRALLLTKLPGDGIFISSKIIKTHTLTMKYLHLIHSLPIGAIALVVLFFFLRLPVPKSKFSEKLKRVDYAGTVIIFAFATLFLLALNFGGQIFPWKSAAVIVPFVLSGVLIALLVVVEKKFAKEPIMPPRLFKNRSVVGIILTNWFMGMTFFSAIYYLPVYFQVVRNDSAMWSGIRLIPMQMVLAVLSASIGFIISKKNTYRPL